MSHFFLVLVLLLCIDAFTQEHSKLSDYDVRHMFHREDLDKFLEEAGAYKKKSYKRKDDL